MTTNPLHNAYPWTHPTLPLIVSAPMMKITLGSTALATSAAGGIGFLAAGFDLTPLSKDLSHAANLIASHPDLQSHLTSNGILPIGVGFQNWGSSLPLALLALKAHPVAAVWFFAPVHLSDLMKWTEQIREATDGKTQIWIQIGTVAEAVEVAKTSKPDVIVVQGYDAGGHGLEKRASLMTLLPEVHDRLASEGISTPLIGAGGIMDGRGAAAALTLGASGVALGTRFLACAESVISKGYQAEILRATDGGVATVGTRIYDVVREIKGWPVAYNGRGVVNRSYLDMVAGMEDEENIELYKEALGRGDQGWGVEGRMTTYAGTGVGLVKRVASAEEIVSEIREGAVRVLRVLVEGKEH